MELKEKSGDWKSSFEGQEKLRSRVGDYGLNCYHYPLELSADQGSLIAITNLVYYKCSILLLQIRVLCW